MKSMQSLQPKVLEIREKYRKDPKVMNQKLMELYKKEGVNPMGGCLPMLLQIPVFFALYQALLVSIELRGASFLWIPDLSAPEPYAIKILVLLMGISMFIQQSMTPTTGDPKQAQMFKFMPIIFTAMFWNFPSGLVLYWLVNNVLSIGQQYLINRGDATGKKAVSDKKRKVNKG
jgi:YidC/Oxa1 family membrane protein insertase